MSLFGLHASVLGLGTDSPRLEARAEQLGEAGFGLLELPLARPRDVEPARLRAVSERRNLALLLSLPGLPAGLDVFERAQDALDFLDKMLAVCAEAGSFGLGGMVYDTPGSGFGERPPSQKEIDALSRFLERGAKLARAHRVKLGLGPASRFETRLVNRAADAAWLVERVGAENLFIHLDTFAMNTEEESWAEAFAAAAPYLGAVELSESNRGVPGRGLLDWTAVFKALVETEAACPLIWRGAALETLASGGMARRRSDESPDELFDTGLSFLRAAAGRAGIALQS